MMFVCCFSKNETWFNFLPRHIPALNSAGIASLSIFFAFQTISISQFQPRASVFRTNLWHNMEVKTKKGVSVFRTNLWCFETTWKSKQKRGVFLVFSHMEPWKIIFDQGIRMCQTVIGSCQSSSDIYFFYDALVGQCWSKDYISQVKTKVLKLFRAI